MIGARVHAFAGAFLLAFPRPTAEQMQPYVGAWKQVNTPGGPDSGVETTITFLVKDGRGAGRMVTDLPVDRLVQDFKLLRLTSNGIEFGFMNGMHPRGVIAHDVHLKGGKLVGEWDFKGVYMDMPGMQQDPTLEFVRADRHISQ